MAANTKVLVTGGTGFLGKRLVMRLLHLGREVVVLARNPSPDLASLGVKFACASIDDTPAVSAACEGVGTVFHVAAKVGIWGSYDKYFPTNVLGTRAVLNGCRVHRVPRLVYTSTPSVVYNGRAIAGGDESMPLTTNCPAAYALTKAIAEREVVTAHGTALGTIALRPHLIWGLADPHLVPRVLEQARSGRLRIIGNGRNKVDMVHVENAVDAHLLAEKALESPSAGGKPYFITNGEPVALWDWINELLRSLEEPEITKRVPAPVANTVALACETLWSLMRFKGEPPITRFVASELAKDHWFDISAARRDLDYTPRVSMAHGTAELVAYLKSQRAVSPPRRA